MQFIPFKAKRQISFPCALNLLFPDVSPTRDRKLILMRRAKNVNRGGTSKDTAQIESDEKETTGEKRAGVFAV